MLDQPVESSGELLFIAPDRLEKRTLKPKPETMVLDGDTLTLERGQRKRVLHLKDHPEVAGLHRQHSRPPWPATARPWSAVYRLSPGRHARTAGRCS